MGLVVIDAIQDYRGKSEDGKDSFVWNQITVPKDIAPFIDDMNVVIPLIFGLEESERQKIIDKMVLSDNNAINQYFPFLKEYSSIDAIEFVSTASGVMNSGYNQKRKRQ